MALASQLTHTRQELGHCTKGLGACSSPSWLPVSTQPEVVILCSTVPSIDNYFPMGNFHTARHQRCLHFLGTGATFPKSSPEITSWNTPQALLFQAGLSLPHTTSFWNPRVTSQLWRSVCPDPVRAIPSLYLFKTAVTNHCSFLSISHWV